MTGLPSLSMTGFPSWSVSGRGAPCTMILVPVSSKSISTPSVPSAMTCAQLPARAWWLPQEASSSRGTKQSRVGRIGKVWSVIAGDCGQTCPDCHSRAAGMFTPRRRGAPNVAAMRGALVGPPRGDGELLLLEPVGQRERFDRRRDRRIRVRVVAGHEAPVHVADRARGEGLV